MNPYNIEEEEKVAYSTATYKLRVKDEIVAALRENFGFVSKRINPFSGQIESLGRDCPASQASREAAQDQFEQHRDASLYSLADRV